MMFVKVAESDNPEETVEIPIEPQGHILMSTLTAQFPGACGLKFKTEQSSWRGVRVVEDKIYPPGDDKWDEKCVYIITYPKDSKRKGDDLDINSAKSRKIERKCVDLIVLGIPWKSTEDVVRRYFEQYGEVVLCEIKRDAGNNSKGFGFVRFKDYNNQCLVLGKKHFIDGRWCDVKIPNSQEPETSRKIFVGRLSETLTSKDLQDYFSQYGQVIDVYIPKPFRAFGFVTFVEADVAQGLCGESHIIKGVSVHVSRADPKEDENSHTSHQSSHYQQSSHHRSSHHSYQHNNPSHHSSQFSHRGGNSHNQSDNRRFSSNTTHSHSSPHISSLAHNSNIPNSKSMIHNRNKKFDQHSMHGNNSNDMFDRHNDIRSPNIGPHFNHHQTHQQAGSNMPLPSLNGSNNLGIGNNATSGFANNDQMSAMMNMFNPMMAAFIQQLASQSNLIQPNAQSAMDTQNNPATVISGLSHHPSTAPTGVPPPPWTTNPNTTISGAVNGQVVSTTSNYNSRFKGEKNF